MISKISVSTTASVLIPEAQQLADQLLLPFTPLENPSSSLQLVLTETHLELRDLTQPKLKPLFINFNSAKFIHRQRFGGGRGQLIARAVGLKSKIAPHILDLTAGFGEDAYVLATLGCTVTMVERNPIVAALLRDALTRLPSPCNLNLIEADSLVYLKQLSTDNYPDVIYLDPMFPESTKSALVKKEMQLLRIVVGKDPDADQLLELALSYTKKRVVVKRARLSPLLNAKQPDVVFTGKSSRFDVYLKHE